MLILTIEVDAPAGMSMAIKEDLAMRLECYGNVRVTNVEVKKDGVKNG